MLERTYRARRFDEALAQLKRDLGPDAIIVSSRRLPGRLGGPDRVELIALPKEAANDVSFRSASMAAPQSSSTGTVEAPGFLERRLLRAGVPPSAARELAESVKRIHGAEPPSMLAAEPSLCAAIAEGMIFAGPIAKSPRVVALVGPTGAGKTTTTAKLAAHCALVEGRKVALISIDQYRIAGAEQLERYADLMEVPMEVASDAATLDAALRRLAKADLVLIDTAGRSPRDRNALQEMADTLHGVKEPIEVHLCIAAGARDSEIQAIVDRHAILRPTRLNVTKIDEAVDPGSIVCAEQVSGLPLSYFCTGQRVPEDMEVATPQRLASLLCGMEIQ